MECACVKLWLARQPTYTQDPSAGSGQALAAALPVVLQSKTGTTTTKYLNNLGTRPLAQNATAWEYLLPDALGSVRQIADTNGNVTLAKSYEPYGTVLTSTGSAGTIFGFAGEQTDNTGRIFLRARYLQPRLGLFLSRDPWRGDVMRPGSMNGFGYGLGNPINATDPSGRIVRWPCIWPNREEQDPKTGQLRCVSPFGVVIGQVGAGTLPGTGDPASELLKWLALAGINICVDVATEIIREQRYEPQVIVELGAGDYSNAIAMKEKFPSANVFATNLVAEWEWGKLVDEGVLPYNKIYDHVLAVYRGFKDAKKEGVIVGITQPIENKDVVQRLPGMADIVYAILPYLNAAVEFGAAAGILAKNQPGTIVFVSEAGSGSSELFIMGFQSRRSFANFGWASGVPFDLDATKWESGRIISRIYIQMP